MTKSARIPWSRAWSGVLTSAMLAAIAFHRAALIQVRAGFENSPDPRARLVAEVDRLREHVETLNEELRLVRARLAGLNPRARPHYPPVERFAILKLRAKTGWNMAETARRFLVAPATIAGWARRVDEKGEAALVKTNVPVNRHPDRVALLVKELYAEAPGMGRRRIADVLARAGLVLAASTVERLKRRPQVPHPPVKRALAEGATPSSNETVPEKPRVVEAKYTHHLWHIDITSIATAGGNSLPWWPFALFSLWPFSWHIALVLNHFSRSLVAFAVFRSEPSAQDICSLLDRAVVIAGTRPRHTVSDQGSQFQIEYRDWCTRNGAKPRYGAIGKHGSIAVIERVIRSLKHECLREILVPFSRFRIEAELVAYQLWYNDHRPHHALGGATPRERAEGRAAGEPRTRYEPRPRYPIPTGEHSVRRCERLELVVTHVGGRRHLPIVELREAA